MPYNALKLTIHGLLLATTAVLIVARVVDFTTAGAASGDVIAQIGRAHV